MQKKPNIVFFFSDQQRWDTAGCYGQSMDITPNLDKLAAEGVRFENAFTCQPVCGPARACLQTGVYPTEVGCFRNNKALPLDANTIAQRFKEAGYSTAYIGKWHLASDDKNVYRTIPVPVERRGGYEYWMASDVLEFTSHGYDGYVYNGQNEKVDFKGYRADCITDFALDYLDTQSDEKPFFMFLSHIEPHHQNDRNRYEGPDGSKRKYKDFEVPGDLKDKIGDWRENYPDYLGCCNSLDYNLGRLVDKLKEKGLYENTVIFYTSDHGSHFKTRNSEYKRACFEGCIRIPLVIAGPGFSGGKVVDQLVSLVDIPPTFMEIAGVDKPDYMFGDSLVDLNELVKRPNEVFIQVSESQVGRALRTARWKYSVSAPQMDGAVDSYSDEYCEEFLFDLEADPYENNNLVDAKEYYDVRDELRKSLLRHIEKAEGKKPVILQRVN